MIFTKDSYNEEEVKKDNIVKKYEFIKSKIIKHYTRGCKMLASAKIISAVLFAVFTVIGIAVSNHTGSKMLWLVLWIIVILLNVAVFIITDYCKYLIKDRVIPYLEDDEQIEFKEYSIFLNDDDKPTEEEK